MSSSPQRLPAPERRQAILDAATRVFVAKSYSGATTAEIAREAGVSEPILYRHFPSKLELYLAALQEAWDRLRHAVEEEIAQEPDPAEWPLTIKKAVMRLKGKRLLPPHFWIQALSDAGSQPEIRRFTRAHLRDVHAFFRDIIVRSQKAGGVPAELDAEAEAWIQVAVGLLRSVDDRLGGIIGNDCFGGIAESRRRSLSGRG